MIYLIGSLRNGKIPALGKQLRAAGHDVFDDWWGAGPEADDWWKTYEGTRGRSYRDALKGHAAEHVFGFDKRFLEFSSDVVLVLPAGRSGHMELAWSIGKGKRGFILFEEEPSEDRWDLMYRFVYETGGDVLYNTEELIDALK